MDNPFLITGASKGIGKAIAERLIARGEHVVGIARQFDWKSPLLLPVTLDLSDLNALPHNLSMLKRQVPNLNGLICCSGQGRFGSLEEFSYAQIRELIDLNFLSQVYLIKAYLPMFKKQKRGTIIMIGSEAALKGKKEGSVYCASKFALRGFCQALREECASSLVRVTLINPGMVKTTFFDHLDFAPGSAVHEHILPEDVAEITLHVLNSRFGIAFDEINLTPQTKKIIFK